MHIDMNAFSRVSSSRPTGTARKPIAVIAPADGGHTASYEAAPSGEDRDEHLAGPAGLSADHLRGRDNRKYADTSTRIVAMMRDYTPLWRCSPSTRRSSMSPAPEPVRQRGTDCLPAQGSHPP